MTKEQFVRDTEQDDEYYICYHPSTDTEILHCSVESDSVTFYLATGYSLDEVLPLINKYLEFLKGCTDELSEYIQSKTDENLPDNWTENIEVYDVDITIDAPDDFGATVSLGEIEGHESVLGDHILELDFERYEIVDDRLNG